VFSAISPNVLSNTLKAYALTTVHNSTGNIYEDLGYVNATEMHIKATLSAKISEAIKSRRLMQTQAAIIFGVSRITVSSILRGHFRDISKPKLIDCLRRLAID
jgi:predicted XRE-type DNA-binding protein